MDEKTVVKLAKAKQAEARAIETAEMKMLYAAFIEGGMDIDTACDVLKNSKTDEQKTDNGANLKNLKNLKKLKNLKNRRSKLDRATGWVARVVKACVSCDVLLETMDKMIYNACVSCDCLEVLV